MTALPEHVRGEVQRILDGAARGLLAEQMHSDALGTPAGRDVDPVDGGADEGTALGVRQPVVPARDHDGPARAA